MSAAPLLTAVAPLSAERFVAGWMVSFAEQVLAAVGPDNLFLIADGLAPGTVFLYRGGQTPLLSCWVETFPTIVGVSFSLS